MNIKRNRLKTIITVDKEGVLLDGRNRLEALERAGVEPRHWHTGIYRGDLVAYILSANIHRRHLTKAEKAEAIVRAIKAWETPPQLQAVSKGGRGKVTSPGDLGRPTE